MASRKEQKEAARQRRLAEEAAAQQKAQRTRRMQMLGGVIVAAIIVVVVLVVASSGGTKKPRAVSPTGPQATRSVASVDTLLRGIPQAGNVLGSPHAAVTVTEYGDLVCPVCQGFALGVENQLISRDVRAGKVKIAYRGLETASQTANNSMFVPSQTAALAAGEQKLGWYYIELFYHEQQSEETSYVTTGFLQGLARQIHGLNFSKWNVDRSSSSLAPQITADGTAAQRLGFNSTPSLTIQGPVSQTTLVGVPTSYAELEHKINLVAR